ncbi:MAG TPA: sigma-70 domain-containing protein [Polyangia bacterium]|nr:sigma-70 domain-containing protein [Polyangia bacterium]
MTSTMLSAHLQEIFDAIMAAHPDGLTLNVLSEELANKPVTYADIEEIIGALEEAGVDLEAPEAPARPEELFRVLAAARALTAETGKRPSPEEIAERAGLTAAAVRRSLRFGRAAAP